MKYCKVGSSRPVIIQFWNFSAKLHKLSIKFPLHKPSENPTARDFTVINISGKFRQTEEKNVPDTSE